VGGCCELCNKFPCSVKGEKFLELQSECRLNKKYSGLYSFVNISLNVYMLYRG